VVLLEAGIHGFLHHFVEASSELFQGSVQRRASGTLENLDRLEIGSWVGKRPGSVQRPSDGGNDQISLENFRAKWVWEDSVRGLDEKIEPSG